MANAILNSNASSSLVAALSNTTNVVNPFIYSMGKKNTLGPATVPAHSRTVTEVLPTSYGWNQNIDFQVLKAGELENCFLKITVQNGNSATNKLNTNFFNLIVEEVQILTAGKVLMRNVPFGRAALMSQKPFNVRKNIEGLLKINRGAADFDVTHTGTNTKTGYLPLLMSCFDVPELYYSSQFVEPMQIRIRLSSDNKYSFLADGTAQSLTLTGVSLVQIHRQLPSDLEQKTIAANYSDTESLVRVQNEVVCEETKKLVANAANQEIEHTITTNRCINKLFVAVENPAAATAGQYLEIDSIEIKANGQLIVDMPGELMAMGMNLDVDSANSGQCVGNFWEQGSGTATPHTQRIYCYNFSMNSDASAHLTGLVSAREINSFTVKVKFTAAAGVSHTLHVGALTPFLESINSASGKISTSLSS